MILHGHGSTPDELDLVTSAAGTIHVLVSVIDCSDASPPVPDVPSRSDLAPITTATTTTLTTALGAAKRRRVIEVLIFNASTTVSNTVTVIADLNASGSNAPEVAKETLLPGEALQYAEGYGWFPRKLTTALFRAVKLGSDFGTSSTTTGEVTGLSVTTGLGTFVFKYSVLHQSAATTTGTKFDVNHTGTVTAFVWNQRWLTNVALNSDDVHTQSFITSGAGVLSGFASRAKGTAGRGAITDLDTANADMLTIIEGLCIVTVDGDLELWYASEAAAASTVKAGSSLILTRTGD